MSFRSSFQQGLLRDVIAVIMAYRGAGTVYTNGGWKYWPLATTGRGNRTEAFKYST
jgi:hypothetical protein